MAMGNGPVLSLSGQRDCSARVITTFGIGVQSPAPETGVEVQGAAAVLVTVSVPAVTMPNTA